ncbi:MAG: hypothetical protein RLZZ175_2335 [Bacteroidota bacterium]|jgi:oligoendopeptidase F
MINIPTPRERIFLPQDFKVTDWENLQPYFQQLKDAEINSDQDLLLWLKQRSELESVLEEEMGWRYVRMTCFTENEEYRNAFNYIVTEIEPNISPESNELDKKALASPFLANLKGDGYNLLHKKLKSSAELFREENIPLFTEMQTQQQVFGQVNGAMTVTLDGKELTLQQAGVQLQNTDRAVRENVYKLIQSRRLQDKKQLDELLISLVDLRHKVAVNAGFSNYRDYMFEAMGRYDYTPKDCFDFHNAIKQEVVPILDRLAEERKKNLGVSELRPWDLAVDPQNLPALKPFENGEELLEKSIACFDLLDPYFSNCLKVMKKMERLDLVSRKGKSPGGYNYPLDETGIPFIFMNATSTLQDLVTMVHEGGHAIQSFLTIPLELNVWRGLTSEIAELASMSMELMSMEKWDVFFSNPEELKRAKLQQLEHIIETLPWVATIDKFQHWLYENHTHTIEERTKAWLNIHNEFRPEAVQWTGLEEYQQNVWQKQLHIYEVPFYYIEYGMAQLGAIAVWKNFKENPTKAIAQYKEALALGYSKSIKDVYATAGVKFDFSANYIKELMDFVQAELEELLR